YSYTIPVLHFMFCYFTVSKLLYLVIIFFLFTFMGLSVFYTLSLHDALPILFLNFKDVFLKIKENYGDMAARLFKEAIQKINSVLDRKSTRLNSSHVSISYAVFCLKKKKHTQSLHEIHSDNVVTPGTTNATHM